MARAQCEYEKWYGVAHPHVADVLHEYARLLSNQHNTYRIDEARAQALYRRALELRMRAYGPVSLKTASTMFALGTSPSASVTCPL